MKLNGQTTQKLPKNPKTILKTLLKNIIKYYKKAD